jgi:ATP-dependent RNA helicase RhlE
VVNFDVPKVPDDYIHRVGRTARAEAVGDAFTFVAPDEENGLRGIERVIGKRLPRVIVPDFDYAARAGARLEIPIGDRIVAIRAKKAEDRARAEVRTKRRMAEESARREGSGHEPRTGPGGSRGGRGRRPRPS